MLKRKIGKKNEFNLKLNFPSVEANHHKTFLYLPYFLCALYTVNEESKQAQVNII